MAVVGRNLPQLLVVLQGCGRRYLAALLILVGCWFVVAITIRLFIKM
jgi:hypothetical protein